MNVLILDDEFFIRENIYYGIDWDSLKIDRVFQCEDGEEAIELCSREAVEIVISDIRMNGLSGLDTVRQMREIRPDLKVIFISGYPEKEYLKDAIRLQAVNFIEKPVNMEELSEILRSVTEEICVEKQNNLRLMQADGRERIRMKIQLCQMIPSAGEKERESLLSLAAETEFYRGRGQVVAAVAVLPEAALEKWDNLFLDRLYERLDNYIEPTFHVIAAVRHDNLLVFFSGNLRENRLYYHKKIQYLLHTVILEPLMGEADAARVGLSLPANFEKVRESYIQACIAGYQAFFLLEGNWKIFDGLASDSFSFDNRALEEMERQLEQHEPEKTLEQLENVYKQLLRKNDILPSSVVHFYNGVARMIWDWSQRHQVICFSGFTDLYAVFDHLGRQLFLRDIHHFLTVCLETAIKELAGDKYSNDTVNYVIRYISRHYMQLDLSVQSISDAVHMAPNYLTSLFKRHTHDTINHYITACRIDAAKRLLETTDISVNDIARQTGFRDAGYFSKVFYRYVRQTPSEYRRASL